MGLASFFRRPESLLAVDIGSTSLKVVELEGSKGAYRVVNLGIANFAGEIYSNNTLAKPDAAAEQLLQLMESNGIEEKRVVTAVPAPSVFTKRIKMARPEGEDLSVSVQMEAANFIPHNIDAVKLDYQVLGEFGKNQLDVLVVAVKNEVIDSLVDAVSLASLDVGIVDVDYFALQNMFEISYSDMVSKTVALINIGARYSSIAICRDGEPLFTGDMGVGGRLFTEALVSGLNVKTEEAEKIKTRLADKKPIGDALPQGATEAQVNEILSAHLEFLASEFNRQLSFFWNASGADDGIDMIFITGGGSLLPGLTEQLSKKAGIPCEMLDPFRGIELGDGVDPQYAKEVAPFMAIAVGLGARRPGDKAEEE